MTFVANYDFCRSIHFSPKWLMYCCSYIPESVAQHYYRHGLFCASQPLPVLLFAILGTAILFIIYPTVLEQNFGFSNKEGLPDSQTMLFRPQPLTREATSLLTNASRLMSLFCVKIRSAPGWTTCVICFTLQRDIVGHRYF